MTNENQIPLEVVKKELYKQDPTAHLYLVRGGNVYYDCTIILEDIDKIHKNFCLVFVVPVNDMGTTDFYKTMPAKHLIRWLNVFNKQ